MIVEAEKIEIIQIAKDLKLHINMYKTHIEFHITKGEYNGEPNYEHDEEECIFIKLSEITSIQYKLIDKKYNLILYTTNMMHYITNDFSSLEMCAEAYSIITSHLESYLQWNNK